MCLVSMLELDLLILRVVEFNCLEFREIMAIQSSNVNVIKRKIDNLLAGFENFPFLESLQTSKV